MKENSIYSIQVFPKCAHRWAYVINQGRTHLADVDSIRDLIFSVIEVSNRPKAIRALHELQYMLILPEKEGQVFLLKPKDVEGDVGAHILSSLTVTSAERQYRAEKKDKATKTGIIGELFGDLFRK